MGLQSVWGNGYYPTAVESSASKRWVGYAKEPDAVAVIPVADVRATASGYPAAWLAPPTTGSGLVGVFGLGLRASDVCPLARARGEQVLAEVFGGMASDLAYER